MHSVDPFPVFVLSHTKPATHPPPHSLIHALSHSNYSSCEPPFCFLPGKVVRLRQKLSDITGAVTGIFGKKAEKDPAVARLDALKVTISALKRCSALRAQQFSLFLPTTHTWPFFGASLELVICTCTKLAHCSCLHSLSCDRVSKLLP